MNEEPTKDLPGKKSFEERVFARFDTFDARFDTVDARFDAIDARFDAIDARLEKLIELRSHETNPIWEIGLRTLEIYGASGRLKSNFDEVQHKAESLLRFLLERWDDFATPSSKTSSLESSCHITDITGTLQPL